MPYFPKRARLARAACLVLLTSLLGLASPPVRAAEADAAADAGDADTITVAVSKSHLIRLPAAATTVFIADPTIADVQVPDSRNVIIFGKKPGSTHAYAFSGQRKIADYSVTVTRPVGEIEKSLKRAVPGADVHVSSTPGGIVVGGRVATPAEAQKLKDIAGQYLGDKDKNSFDVAVGGATAGEPARARRRGLAPGREEFWLQLGRALQQRHHRHRPAHRARAGRGLRRLQSRHLAQPARLAGHRLPEQRRHRERVDAARRAAERGPGLDPGRAQPDHHLRRTGQLSFGRRNPGAGVAGPAASHDRVEELRRRTSISRRWCCRPTASASRSGPRSANFRPPAR